MVRKKIDNINYIADKANRLNTFQKRKRGFLKKAIEFCHLCGLDMLMVIHDSEQNRLIEFRSSKKFSTRTVNNIKHLRKSKNI